MRNRCSLSMVEPPIWPPDGYYRWLDHAQEFSDEKRSDTKNEVCTKSNIPSAAGIVGLFFGIGCLFYALIFKRKKK